jgi:hypothetical protein
LDFDGQIVFWAPEALPTVLRVSRVATTSAVSRAYDLDLSNLPDADLREALDGWHAVILLGGVTHRLWLRELPASRSPIVLELPLDADFDLQLQAAYRLRSALAKRRPRRTGHGLTFHRRQRLVLAIRALDGRNQGNSYRAIATGLFGASRIPERSWKTHDLRNRTIRLVRTGLSLMRGGYRALLRRRGGSG